MPYEIDIDDYGEEVWFGGSGCGMIKVGGNRRWGSWYAGGWMRDPEKWAQQLAQAQLFAHASDLFDALKRLVENPSPETRAAAEQVLKAAVAPVKVKPNVE